VFLTSDSAADLPPELRAEIGLHTVPLHIQIEDKSGRDGVDIFPQDIYAAFHARKSLPKTAAPAPEEFKALFEGLTRQGAAVVHIALNSKFSACYQNAALAAKEVDGEIYVLDSLNCCAGQGMLCMQAARLRGQGLPAAEIAEAILRLRAKVVGVYYVDALHFLSKSGRCPGIVALGANLLGLHPTILFDGATGTTSIGKKYRGKSAKAAEAWVRDAAQNIRETCDPALCLLLRTPDIPPEFYEPLHRLAAELLPGAHLTTCTTGCTIASHAGDHCFGLVGIEK